MTRGVEERVALALGIKGPLTPTEIARRLGYSKIQVAQALRRLRHKGVAAQVDKRPDAIRHRGPWTLAGQ